MPKHRKPSLLPIARSLAAAGHPTPTIAQALSVPLRTCQRWAQADAAAGRPWAREQRPARHARSDNVAAAPPDDQTFAPGQVIANLRDRLQTLAAYAPPVGKEAGYERRILDLTKAIEALRNEFEDPIHAINAMGDFLSFSQAYPEADLPEASKAGALQLLRAYLSRLDKGYPVASQAPREEP